MGTGELVREHVQLVERSVMVVELPAPTAAAPRCTPRWLLPTQPFTVLMRLVLLPSWTWIRTHHGPNGTGRGGGPPPHTRQPPRAVTVTLRLAYRSGRYQLPLSRWATSPETTALREDRASRLSHRDDRCGRFGAAPVEASEVPALPGDRERRRGSDRRARVVPSGHLGVATGLPTNRQSRFAGQRIGWADSARLRRWLGLRGSRQGHILPGSSARQSEYLTVRKPRPRRRVVSHGRGGVCEACSVWRWWSCFWRLAGK